MFEPGAGIKSSGIPLSRRLLRASCKILTECAVTKPLSLNHRRWRWKCSRQFMKYCISSDVTTALLATSFTAAYSPVNSFVILWETTSAILDIWHPLMSLTHAHYGSRCFLNRRPMLTRLFKGVPRQFKAKLFDLNMFLVILEIISFSFTSTQCRSSVSRCTSSL